MSVRTRASSAGTCCASAKFGCRLSSNAAAVTPPTEETGVAVDGEFVALAPVRQKGGKAVVAWAIEADCDAAAITSNSFSLEWPPRSGKHQDFPEVDEAAWFALAEARRRINPAQAA